MDGKYDGSPSSWEAEIETKHLSNKPHFAFQKGHVNLNKK